MGNIAGRVGGEEANRQIGDGLVRRRRGRPRKMKGGAMFDGLVKKPKLIGITEPLVNVPLISSGVMSMKGKGWMNDLMDKPFTARQAIQAAKKVPSLAREAVDDIKGAGFLDSVLDKPFTARQAIQAAKKVPSLAREAVDDIKGAGLKKRLVKGSAEAKAHMARIRGMKKK